MKLCWGLHSMSEAGLGPTFEELLIKTNNFLSAFRDDQRILPHSVFLFCVPTHERRKENTSCHVLSTCYVLHK